MWARWSCCSIGVLDGVERTFPMNEWLCKCSDVAVLIKRMSANADAFL
jgi:hypothetical protein